ncbi:hypothetical protein [Rugamonas sp.]|uniref:hypothetical protein n=1 Tax=Rugamonas sp. TaxID=1926287 RepID=UPI0025EAB281|nr:hypothetical protein [Rugamonas sp.]
MSDADFLKNPYFKNPERAPYELGHLLMKLPANLGMAPVVDDAHMQMAAAVEDHASDAFRSVLNGLEAVGQLMEIAGVNGDEGVSPHTLLCLGELVRHLAVEGQFLRETADRMAIASNSYRQDQLQRMKGGRDVR